MTWKIKSINFSLKPWLLGLCLLAQVNFISAQTEEIEVVNSDRPDMTDGVQTVSKGRFQIENGLTFAKQTVENNWMLRVGISKSTEVRLGVDAGLEDGLKGLKPLTLSFKQRLLEEQGFFPALTLIGGLSYGEIASKEFQENKLDYELILSFENTLTDKLSLGYNIGISNNFKDLNFTIGLGYDFSDKIATYLEYYSVFSGEDPNYNVDFGLLYHIKPKLQIDMAMGTSMFEKDKHLFGTIGVSYLF